MIQFGATYGVQSVCICVTRKENKQVQFNANGGNFEHLSNPNCEQYWLKGRVWMLHT